MIYLRLEIKDYESERVMNPNFGTHREYHINLLNENKYEKYR